MILATRACAESFRRDFDKEAEVSGELEDKHSLIIEEAEALLLNEALFLKTGCL